MDNPDQVDAHLRRAVSVIGEFETERADVVDLKEAKQLVSSELAELESLAASRPLRANDIEVVAARYRAARIRLQTKLTKSGGDNQ